MTKVKDLIFTTIALLISGTGIIAKPADRFNKLPFSVIYVGNEGGYLLFRVIVNTVQTISASFEISDRALGSIYSSNIDAPHKVEMLKVGKRNNQELDFKLVIGKDVYSRSFAIS